MPSDARKHLGLAKAYVGNAVYQLTASLPFSTLLDLDLDPNAPPPTTTTSIQQAALVIRASVTAATPELVVSYYAKLRERWLDWAFLEDYDTTGVGMGSGWTSGDAVYGADWGRAFGGKGGVVRFRFPGSGGSCVMPKRADGGAEVVVCVERGGEEEGLLRGWEGFGAYLEA